MPLDGRGPLVPEEGEPGEERPAAPTPRVSLVRERAERDRQAKLDRIEEQVQDGTLVIRQMTTEERTRYPVRDVVARRPRFR